RVALLVVADTRVLADEAVLEDDLCGVRRAHAELAFLAPLAHAGVALLDDEPGDAGGAGRLVRGDERHLDVGDAAVGAELLGAVEDIAAVDLRRRRLERQRVGSRVGLGQAHGGDLQILRIAQPADVFLLLLLGSHRDDAGAGETAGVDRHRYARVPPGT